MKPEFWQEKWKTNQIGFHESEGNTLLSRHFDRLGLTQNDRIFVPLCGKTRDIEMFLSRGLRVVGAELSELAICQLFEDLQIEPKITSLGVVTHYSAENIDIFVGNIFDVTREMLGSVDAVYDRAALVALPYELRNQYSEHLVDITNNAKQLVIIFEYESDTIQGPPFSVSDDDIKTRYQKYYDLTCLEDIIVTGGLKGHDIAREKVWYLRPLK